MSTDRLIFLTCGGLAIAFVVLHYFARLPPDLIGHNDVRLNYVFSFGWIGVYIFFVVSGFLRCDELLKI